MLENKRHLTTHKFTDFALPNDLLLAIKELGYVYCTPIQAKSLPVILSNTNIIGQAETGTGKTATFLIATINRLITNQIKSNKFPIRALILAPTRELAVQIQQEALQLTKNTDIVTGVIHGGSGYEKQKQLVKKRCDILVATVGRAIDFLKQGLINFSNIEILVLDEADRMLDMGFIKDVRYLLKKLPPADKRLNLLFSATISFRVTDFAYELMDDPTLVKTENKSDQYNIKESAYHVANQEKIPLLINLIRNEEKLRAIVFCNMKSTADTVFAHLTANKINATLLSGDVPQQKRQRLVNEFANGKYPVMVATDVAARGLHINQVTHVINFDLPQDPEDYVHRIGRTGRIGKKGKAISFVCESYAFYFPDIEEFISRKIDIEPISEDMLARNLIPPIKKPRPKPQHNYKKRNTAKKHPKKAKRKPN